MTLDEFMATTTERIPTVAEMLELCDELGIKIALKDGKPVLSVGPESRAEAMVLASLFKREPFRSQVISSRLCNAPEKNLAKTRS